MKTIFLLIAAGLLLVACGPLSEPRAREIAIWEFHKMCDKEHVSPSEFTGPVYVPDKQYNYIWTAKRPLLGATSTITRILVLYAEDNRNYKAGIDDGAGGHYKTNLLPSMAAQQLMTMPVKPTQ